MTAERVDPSDGSPSTGDPGSASASGPAGSPDTQPGDWADYEGPGAWGTWALALLLGLFLLSAAATVHSIVVTFTG